MGGEHSRGQPRSHITRDSFVHCLYSRVPLCDLGLKGQGLREDVAPNRETAFSGARTLARQSFKNKQSLMRKHVWKVEQPNWNLKAA